MPSTRLQTDVRVPVPSALQSVPSPDRFSTQEQAEQYRLSARSLIPIAFSRQPDIKSSFHRYQAEEARYDFFYTSRDSLTPSVRTGNTFEETRAGDIVTRNRDHTIELGVEKLFFDTTELDVAVGYRADEFDDEDGSHPFLAANLRYPLWASREKLERTSEEIFWRNQVDDALLGYIQRVRDELERTLFRFYEVVDLRRRIGDTARWQKDLIALRAKLDTIADRDVATDRRRVEAEIAKVTAEVRNATGRFDVEMERLKAACGLPFHVEIELADEPFNPFEGFTHLELFRVSVETDPEIATLRNASKNAEVQLDLARRGRWDLALLLGGMSSLEGGGQHDGASDWSVSVGFGVSAVDPRVTDSLIHQAEASIARFDQAIASRENAIFVDTFEPLTRIETLGESRDQLLANLPRYQADYDNGLEEYVGGDLNIDDLLKRRENLIGQEQEIARLTFLLGANVAELCSATGKFFELLNRPDGGEPGS